MTTKIRTGLGQPNSRGRPVTYMVYAPLEGNGYQITINYNTLYVTPSLVITLLDFKFYKIDMLYENFQIDGKKAMK